MSCPPDWLANLANDVAALLEPMGSMGPIGCHFHHSPDGWEITVFASLTEIIGGRRDGCVFGPRFEVDIKELVCLFTSVTSLRWQSQEMGKDDELGAHLAIEGCYGEETVCVRIPAIAPDRFEPGRQMLVHQRRYQEVW